MSDAVSFLPKRRPAASKLRLIEAGVRLFTRQAGEGFTIRELAREARVNHALVSYHFGGMSGLMAEVVDRCIEELRTLFLPLLENFEQQVRETPPDRMQPLLRDHMRRLFGILGGPKGMALLRAFASPSASSVPGVYSRFSAQVLEPLHHAFAVAAAKMRGIEETSLEAAVLAQCMTAQCMAFYRGARPVLAHMGKDSFTEEDQEEIGRIVADSLIRTAGMVCPDV